MPGWALALPGLGAAGPEATSTSLPFLSPSVAPTFGFGKQGTCPLSCTSAGQASLRASAVLLTWWVGVWRGQNDSRTSASESQRDHLLPCSSIPFSASLLTHLKGRGAHHLTGQCVTWMAFCLLESFPQGIKFRPPLAHTEPTKPSRCSEMQSAQPWAPLIRGGVPRGCLSFYRLLTDALPSEGSGCPRPSILGLSQAPWRGLRTIGQGLQTLNPLPLQPNWAVLGHCPQSSASLLHSFLPETPRAVLSQGAPEEWVLLRNQPLG